MCYLFIHFKFNIIVKLQKQFTLMDHQKQLLKYKPDPHNLFIITDL